MAGSFYAREYYVGDGITNTFSITFPYINRNYIGVYIDGVRDTAVEFITSTTVRTSATPPPDAIVTILRETPLDRQVDFKNTSLLNSSTLNQDSLQMLHLVQEAYDSTINKLGRGFENNWDAEARRITNLQDAVEPTDAMNLRTAQTYVTTAETEANKALTQANRAETEANTAESLKLIVDNYYQDFKNQYITAFVLSGGDSNSLFGSEDYKISGGDSTMNLTDILNSN